MHIAEQNNDLFSVDTKTGNIIFALSTALREKIAVKMAKYKSRSI